MVLSSKINTKVLSALVISLSLIIFAIDLYTPLGVADGFSYIAIMLLTMWTNTRKLTILSAIIGVMLIIAGYFLSPPLQLINAAYVPITNRIVAILVILLCAFLILKFKKMEQVVLNQHAELTKLTEDLKRTNNKLEERVKERTQVLENTLIKIANSEAELKKSLQYEKELSELKTRFVSMASHEFRTPLTTILSSLSLISIYNEQNEREKQGKHIGRIKSAVIHLTDILNDTLSLSKLEEGRISVDYIKLDVNKIIADIVKEMQQNVKHNQKIIYKHKGNSEIISDKKILTHILLNLLSNAIKFSEESSLIEVNSEVSKSLFTLIVKDSGIGIPEEDQKHLFGRFFRGNNATAIQGTGLGLNIVAKYVEIMNGIIEFESRLGKGTTFTINFKLNNTINHNEDKISENKYSQSDLT